MEYCLGNADELRQLPNTSKWLFLEVLRPVLKESREITAALDTE
jgi:hypothetical protein